MSQPLVDLIIERIAQASDQYYRLVIVVSQADQARPTIEELRQRTMAPLLNINLEVSRLMLDMTERQRTLQLPRLLDEVISKASGDLVILKNFELLFDISLKQDPLRLLQRISRNRTVVAFCRGTVEKGYFTYAVPDHPEYRRYSIKDVIIVSAE